RQVLAELVAQALAFVGTADRRVLQLSQGHQHLVILCPQDLPDRLAGRFGLDLPLGLVRHGAPGLAGDRRRIVDGGDVPGDVSLLPTGGGAAPLAAASDAAASSGGGATLAIPGTSLRSSRHSFSG